MREGWEYKTLGEVANVTDYVANGSFATLRENVHYLDKAGYAILVRLADYTNNFDSSRFVYIDEHAYTFLSKSKLYGGEIIMSNVGSIGKSFICPKLSMPMSLAPNSIVINTPNNKFYFYYFNSPSFQSSLKTISSKTALPKFNKTQFKSLSAPIPPLSEQQRIVSELDLLSSIIEKKKEQLKEYDQLAQSIFYDMFGSTNDEKGWEIKKFGEVGTFQRGGGFLKSDFVEKGFPCIHYGQIHTKFGFYTYNNLTSISKELALSKSRIAHKGDVIIAITSEDVEGSCKSVAWMGDYDVAVGAHAAIFSHNQNPIYVSYYFRSAEYNRAKERYARGFKVVEIKPDDIAKIEIPLPPLSLQQSFAEKIEAIEQQKALIQQSIAETETLFNSRMDYYFN